MKFTINYYGHEKTTRTARGAIRVAKQMVATYGQGNRSPCFGVETEAEHLAITEAMLAAQVSLTVYVTRNGVTI